MVWESWPSRTHENSHGMYTFYSPLYIYYIIGMYAYTHYLYDIIESLQNLTKIVYVCPSYVVFEILSLKMFFAKPDSFMCDAAAESHFCQTACDARFLRRHPWAWRFQKGRKDMKDKRFSP